MVLVWVLGEDIGGRGRGRHDAYMSARQMESAVRARTPKIRTGHFKVEVRINPAKNIYYIRVQ